MMVYQSNRMHSPHRIHPLEAGKKRPLSELRRRPSRITAKVDNDLLGADHTERTRLSNEDEVWLHSALQSRLPLF